MRLHYISFFYFNIILFFFFVLKIDLIFFFFLFLRKTHSIFKESFMEYFFQEFDGLKKDSQILDLYENRLYVDFGLDAGLEEFYLQNIYMHYALYDINVDFEAYSGNFTFKWNDSNIEDLNKEKKNNFKKVYIDLYNLDYYYYNLNRQSIPRLIEDDDYTNLYNYKNINRRDFEDLLFIEENEKYYYNYSKIFFVKENFYDIFISDNYFKFINYNNFINNLKKKVLINKYKKANKIVELNHIPFFSNFNNNMLQIKSDILDNSYLKK